jgi:hypothetical protein
MYDSQIYLKKIFSIEPKPFCSSKKKSKQSKSDHEKNNKNTNDREQYEDDDFINTDGFIIQLFVKEKPNVFVCKTFVFEHPHRVTCNLWINAIRERIPSDFFFFLEFICTFSKFLIDKLIFLH